MFIDKVKNKFSTFSTSEQLQILGLFAVGTFVAGYYFGKRDKELELKEREICLKAIKVLSKGYRETAKLLTDSHIKIIRDEALEQSLAVLAPSYNNRTCTLF